MRLLFNYLFRQNQDGTLTTVRPVNINGIVFGSSVVFGRGVVFGGVNVFDFISNDIEADETNGVWIIRGFYRN